MGYFVGLANYSRTTPFIETLLSRVYDYINLFLFSFFNAYQKLSEISTLSNDRRSELKSEVINLSFFDKKCFLKYRCASRLEMKSASNICIEAKRVSRWVSSSIEISFSGRWRVFFESYGMCPRWSCPKRGSSSMHANFFFQERDFSSLVCLASRQEHRAVTKCVFDEGTLHPR